MTRLIDADAIHDFVSEEFKDDVPYEWAWALTAVDHAPAVDAVEVVRCKDCKYGEVDDADFHDQYLCHISGSDWNCGNHFCSYGERKENDYG